MCQSQQMCVCRGTVVCNVGIVHCAQEEPQIMMHRTAAARYDETLRYGCRPKVELLMRLGVKGPWDSWPGQYAWERSVQRGFVPWGAGRQTHVPFAFPVRFFFLCRRYRQEDCD